MNITDVEYIKELARILNDSGLSKIYAAHGGAKVVLEKSAEPQIIPAAITQPAAAGQLTRACAETEKPPVSDEVINFNSLFEVKSPIVGVFYSSPSPDAEPFVGIGDTVKKGDVLCVIEAMKLLNEITAERDGKIVDICVRNGDVAEFGQVLFKMQ